MNCFAVPIQWLLSLLSLWRKIEYIISLGLIGGVMFAGRLLFQKYGGVC
jgi:hypothetical protein